MMSLIMAVCMLPVLLMLYLMERNEATPKKGMILGVTLPPEGQTLPEVQQIAARFQRQLALVCLGCAALAVPVFFIEGEMAALTGWMVWLVLSICLPMVPHILANRDLKALKKARGWQAEGAVRRVVDTKAAEASLPRPISSRMLAGALAVCLLPLALLFVFEDAAMRWSLTILCLCDTACLLLIWVCGRWMFRRRADMVSGDTALNQTLLRVRRLYWDRCWLINLWAIAAINLLIGLNMLWPGELLMLVIFVGFNFFLIGVCLWTELGTRRAQERLTSGVEIVADEDDRWIWGLFYYDPSDRRLMVAKRVGIGTTMNLGRPAGLVLSGVSVLLIVGCVFIGPIMGWYYGKPLGLTLTDTALVASLGDKEKYTISLDEITGFELRDTLPPASRNFGVGMETYLQGSFTISGEGGGQLNLDPTQPPFLRVETETGTFWLGADTGEATREAAAALALRLAD